MDESSEDNNELSTSSSSESEDSDSEPERTISLPPRHGGGGRPRNAGRGRGKKKVRVIDSDDEDLEFDDSEPVEDTDIFPQGYDIEIGQSLVGGPMSLLRPGSDLKVFWCVLLCYGVFCCVFILIFHFLVCCVSSPQFRLIVVCSLCEFVCSAVRWHVLVCSVVC